MRTHRPAAAEPSPGLTLVGLGCVVVEMADSLLARNELDRSRSLVELGMSIFYTASELDDELGEVAAAARSQLHATITRLRRQHQTGSDLDNEWPFQTV